MAFAVRTLILVEKVRADRDKVSTLISKRVGLLIIYKKPVLQAPRTFRDRCRGICTRGAVVGVFFLYFHEYIRVIINVRPTIRARRMFRILPARLTLV